MFFLFCSQLVSVQNKKIKKRVFYIFFSRCTEPVLNCDPHTEVRTKLGLVCTVTPLTYNTTKAN